MSYERTIPAAGLAYDRTWWEVNLDLSERVAVFWPISATEIDIVGYYDTVSEANAAALGAVKTNGAYPVVRVNFFHTSISKVRIGPI